MSSRFDGKLAGDICRVAAVAAFFVAATLILEKTGVRTLLLDVQTFRSLLQGGSSHAGRLISVFAFVLAGGGIIALGVPRLWASAVGGIVYGAVTGSLLSILASLLGASIVYCTGRFLLAQVVERRMGSRLEYWRKRLEENAFWWVLYGRLFPFSNSTLMSLFCGSCKVPFVSYVQGSLLGFMPLAVVFAAFGSGGLEGNLKQVGFAVLVLAAIIILRRMINTKMPAEAHDDNSRDCGCRRPGAQDHETPLSSSAAKTT